MPIEPEEMTSFCNLLTTIRVHSIKSDSTCQWSIYISLANKFLAELPQDTRRGLRAPEDKDFLQYVKSIWLELRSLEDRQENRLMWSYLEKGAD
jgi:hypothetical protein